MFFIVLLNGRFLEILKFCNNYLVLYLNLFYNLKEFFLFCSYFVIKCYYIILEFLVLKFLYKDIRMLVVIMEERG